MALLLGRGWHCFFNRLAAQLRWIGVYYQAVIHQRESRIGMSRAVERAIFPIARAFQQRCGHHSHQLHRVQNTDSTLKTAAARKTRQPKSQAIDLKGKW